MAIRLSKTKAAAIVSGQVVPGSEDAEFEGAEFDSRIIAQGQLFVALKGEKNHGHEYLDPAFARGAALALVEDPALLAGHAQRARLILVPDTYQAFAALAAYWRIQSKAKVAAVTGSLGKTATKEMCAAILTQVGSGTYSKKSFNNNIGVPYTLCRSQSDDRWIVLEMGMNHSGELSALAQVGKPDIAAITCIAPVHTEFFPNLAAIADAKCEIMDGLQKPGVLVINADDQELAAAVARKTAAAGAVAINTFGAGAAAMMKVSSVESCGLDGIRFVLSYSGESAQISMPILGRHNAMNAAAAALIAKTIAPELPLAAVKTALEQFVPPAMRLNIIQLQGGKTLIDDSYNASPRAMKASLEILADFKRRGLMVGAVLGDMLELGKDSAAFHRDIGQQAGEIPLDLLVGVGTEARHYVAAASSLGVDAVSVDSPDKAAVIAARHDFDVLLVKASRGIKLDAAVKTLKEQLGVGGPQSLAAG